MSLKRKATIDIIVIEDDPMVSHLFSKTENTVEKLRICQVIESDSTNDKAAEVSLGPLQLTTAE